MLILSSDSAGLGYITNKILDQNIANTGKIAPAQIEKMISKGMSIIGLF